VTDDKLYTSLSANTIMAKLTNHIQQTRLTTLLTDKHYWLWRWLPLKLLKRQSPTTALFRTTLTRTITLYKLQIQLCCLASVLYM